MEWDPNLVFPRVYIDVRVSKNGMGRHYGLPECIEMWEYRKWNETPVSGCRDVARQNIDKIMMGDGATVLYVYHINYLYFDLFSCSLQVRRHHHRAHIVLGVFEGVTKFAYQHMKEPQSSTRMLHQLRVMLSFIEGDALEIRQSWNLHLKLDHSSPQP